MKALTNIRQPRYYLLLGALGAAMSLTCGMSTARGEPLFSDSFVYPAGSLVGDGPPPGAPPGQSEWKFLVGDPQVDPVGLLFPHVISAGGSVTLMDTGGQGNGAYADLTPINSGTVWIGFLIRQVSATNQGFAVVNLDPGNGTTPPGIGEVGGLYGFDSGGSGGIFTDVAPSTTPVWIAMQLNFTTGKQVLYVNPSKTPGGTLTWLARGEMPMTAAFQSTGFVRIWLNEGNNNGAFEFDEVRIGTTLGDIRTGH